MKGFDNMKVTIAENSKKCYFEDIEIGDIFKYNDNFYLKFSEKGFGDNEDICWNALLVNGEKYEYFSYDEKVIAVKSELIITE